MSQPLDHREFPSFFVLTYFPMMTYDKEYIFLYLLATCMSFFLMRYLLSSLAHFKIWVFVFLLLRIKRYLYILDNSPFSIVSLANVFFQCVACLAILLTFSFTEQTFLILMKPRLSIIA